MNDQKKTLPRFTVFVPSEHEITIQTVPQKEFFEKHELHTKKFDEIGLSSEQEAEIRADERNRVEEDIMDIVDSFGTTLPKEIFLEIGRRYVEFRKINPARISINGPLVSVQQKSRNVNAGLYHILTYLHQNTVDPKQLNRFKKDIDKQTKRAVIVKKNIGSPIKGPKPIETPSEIKLATDLTTIPVSVKKSPKNRTKKQR
jgi:hypothetical protein